MKFWTHKVSGASHLKKVFENEQKKVEMLFEDETGEIKTDVIDPDCIRKRT